LKEIAKIYDRDHTTIIYGVRNAETFESKDFNPKEHRILKHIDNIIINSETNEMTVKTIQEQAYESAKSRGKINPDSDNIKASMQSIRDEVVEALNAYESKNFAGEHLKLRNYKYLLERYQRKEYEQTLKDCFETELADIVIVALSTAEHLKIDLEKFIELKLLYNNIRD